MNAQALRAKRKLLLASVRVTRYDPLRRDEAPRYWVEAQKVQLQLRQLKGVRP